MSATVLAVVISSVVSEIVSISVVALSYVFSRRRDHEADLRKLKLDAHREYVAALSGIVHGGTDGAAQRRYADATNALILVAPPSVLTALYDFQDETSYRNSNRNAERYDGLFSTLARKMREDCHATSPKDSDSFIFRTMDVPPAAIKP